MPSSENFTPNQVWGSSVPEGMDQELTLPSGQTCRAKKMSIDSMIQAGILADADAITAEVNKHVVKVKGTGNKGRQSKATKPKVTDGQPVIDQASLLADQSSLKALIGLMDKAIPHIVTSPVVLLHYTETVVGKTTVTKLIPEERRKEIREEVPGIVFTDQIGFEDKTFLFNWAAGGLTAMLQFRQ